MKERTKQLKKYKFIKADIVRLEDLLIDADPEEKLKLEKEIGIKEREIARINNALTVLNEKEEYVIRATLINNMAISIVSQKLNLSDSRIYDIRSKALVKMDKYLG